MLIPVLVSVATVELKKRALTRPTDVVGTTYRGAASFIGCSFARAGRPRGRPLPHRVGDTEDRTTGLRSRAACLGRAGRHAVDGPPADAFFGYAVDQVGGGRCCDASRGPASAAARPGPAGSPTGKRRCRLPRAGAGIRRPRSRAPSWPGRRRG